MNDVGLNQSEAMRLAVFHFGLNESRRCTERKRGFLFYKYFKDNTDISHKSNL